MRRVKKELDGGFSRAKINESSEKMVESAGGWIMGCFTELDCRRKRTRRSNYWCVSLMIYPLIQGGGAGQE